MKNKYYLLFFNIFIASNDKTIIRYRNNRHIKNNFEYAESFSVKTCTYKIYNIFLHRFQLHRKQRTLAYGVMVTSQILVLLFQVRILVGQPPNLFKPLSLDSGFIFAS